MRKIEAHACVLGLTLILPLIVGCLGDPRAADAAPVEGGDAVSWSSVKAAFRDEFLITHTGGRVVVRNATLPLEASLPVPDGVTLVRAHVQLDEPVPVDVTMRQPDSGRRRCQPVEFAGWFEPELGASSCAAVTAVDVLPTTWTLQVSAAGAVRAAVVEVTFDTRPLDGPAGNLDLAVLSRPVHDVLATERVTVPSWDGTALHVEVTRPDVPGPVPVVIASGPYNAPQRSGGEPAMYRSFVLDWAMRGFAIVVADVRGTGASAGCVDVWGEREQQDSAFLVEWAARQPWSTGRVAFYGQSYLGTTALQSAVGGPPGLEAVIAVAPVPDAYTDWHFGGVPNGEGFSSVLNYKAYAVADTPVSGDDPIATLSRAADRACDPGMLAHAGDPRAVYDAFDRERNLTARAGAITAPVLYTQGYYDLNVKSALAPAFLAAVDAPLLALLGPWGHVHPPRADQEVLFIAWLDEHLKGKDTGVMRLPRVSAISGAGEHRALDAWPPRDARPVPLFPDFAGGSLADEPADGSGRVTLTPMEGAPADTVKLATRLETGLHLSGAPTLRVHGVLTNGGNAHLTAFLREESADGSRLITFGMVNLAHRRGHEEYAPLAPGETVVIDLPFLPVDDEVAAGSTLVLEVRATRTGDWLLAHPGPVGEFTFHGGREGTVLVVPTVDADAYSPTPRSAGW